MSKKRNLLAVFLGLTALCATGIALGAGAIEGEVVIPSSCVLISEPAATAGVDGCALYEVQLGLQDKENVTCARFCVRQ